MPDIKQVIRELADGRREPFKAFGRQWQGDIFYSTIHQRLKSVFGKHYSQRIHSHVCRGLEAEGFYIHS